MQNVESVLLADPKTPFFTRQQLRNKLTVRFGDNWIPDRGVDQILHWLKIQVCEMINVSVFISAVIVFFIFVEFSVHKVK